MSVSKEEGKIQAECLEFWHSLGWFAKKTHEILTSGKPDLRVSAKLWGQMDIELKFKTDKSPQGLTGIKRRQEIEINEMNLAGMPAIGLIWHNPSRRFFVTVLKTEGEVPDWRWIDPVVKRAPEPAIVYDVARRYLSEQGYDSYRFLRC